MAARDALERPHSAAAAPLVRLAGAAPWRVALLIVALLGGTWLLVYAGGGTRSGLTHLFHVSTLVAAVALGRRSAVGVALLAGLLAGPLMPLDTATGEAQTIVAWTSRAGAFLLVAWLAAGALAAVERRYRDELVRQLGRELEPPAPGGTGPAGSSHPGVRDVLDGACFHPVFQPVYSLHDGRLTAVEALTRFDVEPAAPPDVWFARAAQEGLGDELELAAIGAAMAASSMLPAGVALSVNCSPRTLLHPDLLRLVVEREPRPLIIEVTEHAAVEDYVWLSASIERLRRYDVRFAVDDAGAGFASLRHVVRLGPELIKLDISLTQNLRGDPIREALADCLISFARRTGSRLVAEGIEHPADLATWVELGADAAQGYLLGRPGSLPVDVVSDRIVRALPEAPTVLVELDGRNARTPRSGREFP